MILAEDKKVFMVVQEAMEIAVPMYSCDSNCRSVVICNNGLKVLSCNGSIRRHGEIYGLQHGLN